jgi:hypothetical protein
MNYKLFIVRISFLLLLVLFSRRGLAQIEFNYGSEIGVSISHFPKRDSYADYNSAYIDKWYKKISPLTSPLIGLSTQIIIIEHLQFTIDLHYQMTGTRNYIHRQRFTDDFSFDDQDWDIQTFHKLCMPVSAGYLYKIKKIQSSIFIGFAPNFLLSGKDKNKFESILYPYNNFEGNPSHSSFNYNYNPVEYMAKHNRLTYQLLVGFSSSIGQNLRITICFNKGEEDFFYYYPDENLQSVINNDYEIGFTYLFKTSPKGEIYKPNEEMPLIK